MAGNMEFLIRFTHVHETFRLAEIKALAELGNIDLEIVSYEADSPFCFVKVPDADAARKLVERSILAKAIYEVWGAGSSYPELHDSVRSRSRGLWHLYQNASFKFTFDSFQNTRTSGEQMKLIEEFKYTGFEGPIRMKQPDQEYCIFEHWELDASSECNVPAPKAVYLGRFIGSSQRDVVAKYDLKKRRYISTTSMDAELALVTANISLASSGKLFYDPFTGTGSFLVAAAHLGATVWGSDIDGRSIRGKGKVGLLSNFVQYGLTGRFGDSFAADLTNTPLRAARLFDGIICDPPYGVREGLKVLGSKDPSKPKEPVIIDGIARHTQDDYIPPKKPYGFLAMLDDILDFAALSIVDNGRLSFWMPTSNDKEEEIQVPTHPYLEITSVCTQSFNKWCRRLITYRRRADSEVPEFATPTRTYLANGANADDLNPFRKRYFQGFRPQS